MRDLFVFSVATGRVAARAAVPLLAALMLGIAISNLLLRGATRVGPEHEVIGLCILSLSVVAMTIAWIAMLQILGRTLRPEVTRQRTAAGESVSWRRRALRWFHRADNDLVDAIVVSVLPFLIFYGAWGLVNETYGRYAYDVIVGGGSAGHQVSTLTIGGAAAAAFLLRALLERHWRASDNPLTGLGAGIFEGMWMLLALIAAKRVFEPVSGFVDSRWIVHEMRAAAAATTDVVASIPLLGGGLADLAKVSAGWHTELGQAFLEPIVWLVIGLVVLARDLEQREEMIHQWRPVSRVHGRLSALPRVLAPVAIVYEEVREKWVPLAAGLRTALGAGATRLLAFCAAYAILLTLSDWVVRGTVVLVGAHSLPFWLSFDELLTLPVEVLGEALRIALIAVVTAAVLRAEVESQPAFVRGG